MFLPWAMFAYNISFHEGTKVIPFELAYGRKPPTIPMYIHGSSKLEAVDTDLSNREELLVTLKQNLFHAQNILKRLIDKNYDRHDI